MSKQYNQFMSAPFDYERVKAQQQKELENSLRYNPAAIFNLTPQQAEVMAESANAAVSEAATKLPPATDRPAVNQTGNQAKSPTQADGWTAEQDRAFAAGFLGEEADKLPNGNMVFDAVQRMRTFTPDLFLQGFEESDYQIPQSGKYETIPPSSLEEVGTQSITTLRNSVRDAVLDAYNDLLYKHYEQRDALNVNLPTYEEAIQPGSGWRLLDAKESIFHDNLHGKPELKFVHDDGREVVYDGDTLEIETDPRYKATYNYINLLPDPGPNATQEEIAAYKQSQRGHGLVDLAPYFALGNERGDDGSERFKYIVKQLLDI